MKFLRKINYRLYKIQKTAVVVIFAVLLLLAFTQIVLRLFFRGGIDNVDSFIRYLVLWVGFLGASLATYKKRHINIDIVSQMIGAKKNKLVKGIINLVAFIISSALCWGAVVFIMNEMPDSTRIMMIPLWVLELVLPLSFFFMSLRFLQDAIEYMAASRLRANAGGKK